MKIHQRLGGVLSLGLILSLAACGGSDTGNASSGGVDSVTVNSLDIVAMAPLFVAEDKGFFTEEKIKNSYTTADIYAQMALQSKGDLDVNIPGMGGAFFNAINQKLKLKAVGDRNQYACASDSMLLSRTESDISSVAELKGKKVAILARGSATEYWLSKALAKEGLTIDDLGGLSTLGFPDIANALKTGAVDAGFLTQPLAYGLLKDGVAQRLLASYEIEPSPQQGLITMSDTFREDEPEVAARWMAAWIKGVRYYLDPANRDDVVKIVSEHTKVPAATIDAIYGTDQWPYVNPNGRVDTASVIDLDGQWLIDNDILESLPATDDWYDDSVVEAALEEVGEVDATRSCVDVPRLEVS